MIEQIRKYNKENSNSELSKEIENFLYKIDSGEVQEEEVKEIKANLYFKISKEKINSIPKNIKYNKERKEKYKIAHEYSKFETTDLVKEVSNGFKEKLTQAKDEVLTNLNGSFDVVSLSAGLASYLGVYSISNDMSSALIYFTLVSVISKVGLVSFYKSHLNKTLNRELKNLNLKEIVDKEILNVAKNYNSFEVDEKRVSENVSKIVFSQIEEILSVIVKAESFGMKNNKKATSVKISKALDKINEKLGIVFASIKTTKVKTQTKI
jgi:hypothetical protein